MQHSEETIIDPKAHGLNSRWKLRQNGQTIYLEKIRKSRIIMSDARQILTQIEQIKEAFPEHKVALRIGGPICSKSVNFLAENQIEIDRV